jgi:hypothetical protein
MKMEAAFNRRMRKTARTVVWEGAGAQSPAPDPIVRHQSAQGQHPGKIANTMNPPERFKSQTTVFSAGVVRGAVA